MAKVTNLNLGLQSGTENTLYASWGFDETSSGSVTTTSVPGVGDTVSIRPGSTYYNGVGIPSWVMNRQWIVYELINSRAVINRSVDGQYSIMSPIHINNIYTVKSTTVQTKTNNLDHYKVEWFYDSGNGIWFQGSSTTTTLKNATYNFPSNAIKVKVTVTPVSKTYNSNGNSVPYWTGTAVSKERISSENPPSDISTPSVTLDKYTLKATVDNIADAKTDQVEFEVYKDETKFSGGTINVSTARAIYQCTVIAGDKYRVRCRAINLVGSTKVYGNWSAYSAEVTTIPATVSNVSCSVESGNSVRVSWTGNSTATNYRVEYTTNKLYFDSSSEVSSLTVENTYAYIQGLEQGQEWYFRVQALNDLGESGWSEIVYKIIGTKPEAPTTWSLTTTAIIGEPVTLYWVHNSEDGSKQTQANIELTINGVADIITIITDPAEKDELDKIYSYDVDLSTYPEGAEILWRVRTRGITFEYSDWSMQRTINIYAPPVASLNHGDGSGILNSFPYNISVIAGPNSQTAISYHISIISENTYQTDDATGTTVTINSGTEVFSKVFNIMNNNFTYDLMPEDLTLENNQFYNIVITVSMNSGLTTVVMDDFLVEWADDSYDPDASVFIDRDTLCAYISPFCLNNDSEMVENISLSVYRREFDGSFVLIASNIDNNGVSTIVDPHPSLDYARYRIVARNVNTSVNGFSDIPGMPVNEQSIVIQWSEQWSTFNYSGEDEIETPPWTGSMLRLPYNINITESYEQDATLVEYIGREHPVSYYGTQKGVSATWSLDVPKNDKDTIYGLRRLATWAGNAYVREPSGNGYTANVKVSLSIKSMDLTVPVTLSIKRVEGDV